MGIENDLIKIMHKEIDIIARMSEENLSNFSGEIDIQMVDEYIVQNGLSESAEPYLEQPEDVLLEVEQGSRILLGSYTPMQSPGVLVLYQDNMRNFFWGAVRDVLSRNRGIWISQNDLKYTAEALIFMVLWHEQFHFCCDAIRQLLGSTYNPMVEEALAVAYSRLELHKLRYKHSRVSRIHPQFFSGIMQRAYDYTSPVYRDWPHYSDDIMFSQGLIQYFLSQGNKLEHNGVNLSRMFNEMIASLLYVEQNGYIERLV